MLFCDKDLIQEADRTDKYCPPVKDISLDDETMYDTVQEIEDQ